ncbi:uncharacterized protein DS421_1g02370 [Arachis hypogaea]|nr:uncharacterized protein DS421_1g02370 [Arachis hypogaea]
MLKSFSFSLFELFDQGSAWMYPSSLFLWLPLLVVLRFEPIKKMAIIQRVRYITK